MEKFTLTELTDKLVELDILRPYSPDEIKDTYRKIESTGVKTNVDVKSLKAYRVNPLLGELLKRVGLGGVTLPQYNNGDIEPLVFIIGGYGKEKEDVFKAHELVHADFFENHTLGHEIKEFMNGLDSNFQEVSKILAKEKLSITDGVGLAMYFAKTILEYVKFLKETRKNVWNLSETYAWWVTNRLDSDIKLRDTLYGEDVVEGLNLLKKLSPKKVREEIYRANSMEELKENLNGKKRKKKNS